MSPHAEMNLTQLLLVRALVAAFWRTPYENRLVRWGTELHDRFMLPFFVEQDLRDVVADLARFGYDFDLAWFEPHLAFRFPVLGSVTHRGIRLELRHATALRLMALALLGPAFLFGTATRVAKDVAAASEDGHAELIAALARETPPGSVVLIDPVLESRFLDVERRSGRAALVLWKFVPATDAEIVEWYRRIQFRSAVFAEGCAEANAYRFDFLLAAPEDAAALAARCGAPIASAGSWVLLRRS
jgi:hypothetical protein